MLIRGYREEDLDALRSIHAAQGFDYPLPDLTNPLFVTKLVLTDGAEEVNVVPGFSPGSSCETASMLNPAALKGGAIPKSEGGKLLGAALLRLTAEAYLLLDPRQGTPRDRWNALLALHAATERDAWQRGLEDVHAWLPPPIAAKFGRRLQHLGWLRDDAWTPFCKRLEIRD